MIVRMYKGFAIWNMNVSYVFTDLCAFRILMFNINYKSAYDCSTSEGRGERVIKEEQGRQGWGNQ